MWNKPLPSNGEQKGHNGAQFGIKLIFDRQRDRELKIEIREREIEGASKQASKCKGRERKEGECRARRNRIEACRITWSNINKHNGARGCKRKIFTYNGATI